MEDKIAKWVTNAILLAGFAVPMSLTESDDTQLLQFAAFALWPAIWAAVMFKELYEKTQAQLDRTQETLDMLRSGKV